MKTCADTHMKLLEKPVVGLTEEQCNDQCCEFSFCAVVNFTVINGSDSRGILCSVASTDGSQRAQLQYCHQRVGEARRLSVVPDENSCNATISACEKNDSAENI